jgi:quercetin dioxygenase-like cupin family protein
LHGGVQILFIVAGRCRFQHAGGPLEKPKIYIPAGETHWRGATPEARMVHVAMNFAPEAESLEPVSAA